MFDPICFNGVWNCETVPWQKPSSRDSVIPRKLAEEAYKEYVDRYGSQQSFERLHERGGFGAEELAINLYGRIERVASDRDQIRKLCLAAVHLLMAATGPEDGPTSWDKTRSDWLVQAERLLKVDHGKLSTNSAAERNDG